MDRLNSRHPSGRCAWCGRPETPDATLLLIGAGARHTWLHASCCALWREGQRNAAAEALAIMGIVEPSQRNYPRDRRTTMNDPIFKRAPTLSAVQRRLRNDCRQTSGPMGGFGTARFLGERRCKVVGFPAFAPSRRNSLAGKSSNLAAGSKIHPL
jgi:hypothetical protein